MRFGELVLGEIVYDNITHYSSYVNVYYSRGSAWFKRLFMATGPSSLDDENLSVLRIARLRRFQGPNTK